MFTIQYEAVGGKIEMMTFDSRSRQRLVNFLAHFERPVVAVYVQANPITKAVRKSLAEWPSTKTQAAMDFINSRP